MLATNDSRFRTTLHTQTLDNEKAFSLPREAEREPKV